MLLLIGVPLSFDDPNFGVALNLKSEGIGYFVAIDVKSPNLRVGWVVKSPNLKSKEFVCHSIHISYPVSLWVLLSSLYSYCRSLFLFVLYFISRSLNRCLAILLSLCVLILVEGIACAFHLVLQYFPRSRNVLFSFSLSLNYSFSFDNSFCCIVLSLTAHSA